MNTCMFIFLNMSTVSLEDVLARAHMKLCPAQELLLSEMRKLLTVPGHMIEMNNKGRWGKSTTTAIFVAHTLATATRSGGI